MAGEDGPRAVSTYEDNAAAAVGHVEQPMFQTNIIYNPLCLRNPF